MRCLALARELVGRGHDVHVFGQEGTRETVPQIAQFGLPFTTVTGEAAHLVGAIRDWRAGGVDLVLIDCYGVGMPIERALRACSRAIMVIDDLANRPHDCDILMDQNLGRVASDYAGLVPPHCRVLAGTNFALLRPEFAKARTAALARRTAEGGVERILITMGMTDVGGISSDVLQATLAAGTGAAIDVVLGGHAPSLAAIRALCATHPNITLHIDSSDMCPLIAAADLAIGAAGATSWERCCLGLPTLMLVLADNQAGVAAALAATGAAVMIGGTGQDRAEALTRAITALAADPARRHAMVASAAAVCDGRGMERVVEVIAAATQRCE